MCETETNINIVDFSGFFFLSFFTFYIEGSKLGDFFPPLMIA